MIVNIAYSSTKRSHLIVLRTLLLLVCIPLALYLLYQTLPITWDWLYSFRPAALAMLHGQSPYEIGLDFFNPPWTLLVFLPFALLPPRLGAVCFFIAGFLVFAWIARSLTSKPVSMILFLSSMPVLSCLVNGELDWLPMLSFILPAPFALIVAVIKPQVGVGIGLYWLIQSWRTGGIKEIVRNFLPVTLLIVASYFLYGSWIHEAGRLLTTIQNVSIFPYLLPLGFYMLWTRQKHAAMSAGIFLSPYYTMVGISSPLAALLDQPKFLFLAWIVTWSYTVGRLL